MKLFNKIHRFPFYTSVVAILLTTFLMGCNLAQAALVLSEDFSGKNKSVLYNKVNAKAKIANGYAEFTLNPGSKGSNRVNIGTIAFGGQYDSATLNFRVYFPPDWEKKFRAVR